MSAKTAHIPVKKKRRHFPTAIKIILAILTPIAISVAALYYYGIQIRDNDGIYPHISIAGIDMSDLTRQEAITALGLPAYEERIAGTTVTLTFPDESEYVITGSDVGLRHNARDLVNEAYSIGREQDVMQDVISYLLRYDADEIAFYMEFTLDEDILGEIVNSIVDDYNARLNASIPRIYDDRIVYTRGAGHVSADAEMLYELIYNKLFFSFENGEPAVIIYELPESREFIDNILNLRNDIFVQVVSSVFDPATNSATQCTVGVTFDAIEAAKIVSETETGKTATFYFEFTHPEYTQEQLNDLLFRDLIAERTTHAAGASGRITNITLASEAINGLVLLPGEEFSFNEVVGPRTTEFGYKTAPVLMRGELVPGIGGGVCQVSSTIYAAIRPSDLLVTEQQRHGRPISYLPWGWDATVFYGLIDFKFVNNTDYPIRIEIELEGRNLTARVFGTIIDDFPRTADWNS